jgi:hypothetical protein
MRYYDRNKTAKATMPPTKATAKTTRNKNQNHAVTFFILSSPKLKRFIKLLHIRHDKINQVLSENPTKFFDKKL